MVETRCLLIGPMRNMKRYECLASELRRWLPDCDLRTPTPDKSDSITANIIREIDGADIVIADVTGNRPSVMYEIGICHSIGTPTLLVRDSSVTRANKRPFDTSDILEIELDFGEFPLAGNSAGGRRLREALDASLRLVGSAVRNKGDVATPVTAYYGAPIAEVWPGPGLAYGYFRSFVSQLMGRLHNDAPRVRIGTGGGPETAMLLEGVKGTDIVVKLVMPDRVNEARHEAIRREIAGKGLISAWVEDPHHAESRARPLSLYAWPVEQGKLVLVDVCTAIGAVDARVIDRAQQHASDLRVAMQERFERQEISRFKATLQSALDREQSSWDSKAEVIDWAEL